MYRPPRDHDIVEDVDKSFLVVVGNLHPPNGLIAYLKYVRTNKRTLWKYGDTYYERILKTYSVRNLHQYVSKHQEFTYDEILNTYVPLIKLSSIRVYYYPELRFREIMSKASDELELTVLEFSDILRTYVKNVSNYLGVTGSLLTKTHNVEASDIDMTIYGCRCSSEFLESLNNLSTSRPTHEEISKQSKTHGLPFEVVAKIYPPFKKLLIRGKVINVIFVDDSQTHRYGSEIYVNLHPIELVADIRPYDCRSLFYPSTAYIDRVFEVKYPESYVRHHDIAYVVSYEGLYSYVLYRGGRLRIRGILQKIIPNNKYRVLVGGIEEPGYVIPH